MDRDHNLTTDDLARGNTPRDGMADAERVDLVGVRPEAGADPGLSQPGQAGQSGYGGDKAPANQGGSAQGGQLHGDAPAGAAGRPDRGVAVQDQQPVEQGYPATGGGTAGAAGGGSDRAAGGNVSLLGAGDQERFRQRWSDAQAHFVDDPREAVQTADTLVAELMQSLAQGFSEHKSRLESAWQRGGDPDTEDLRQALQRYRSFFDRLLST